MDIVEKWKVWCQRPLRKRSYPANIQSHQVYNGSQNAHKNQSPKFGSRTGRGVHVRIRGREVQGKKYNQQISRYNNIYQEPGYTSKFCGQTDHDSQDCETGKWACQYLPAVFCQSDIANIACNECTTQQDSDQVIATLLSDFPLDQ